MASQMDVICYRLFCFIVIPELYFEEILLIWITHHILISWNVVLIPLECHLKWEIHVWFFSSIHKQIILLNSLFRSEQIKLQSGEKTVEIVGLTGSFLLQIKNAVSVFMFVQCYSH